MKGTGKYFVTGMLMAAALELIKVTLGVTASLFLAVTVVSFWLGAFWGVGDMKRRLKQRGNQ